MDMLKLVKSSPGKNTISLNWQPEESYVDESYDLS